MTDVRGTAGSLVFKRSLDSGRVWVRTECQPGSVTVLQDVNGADLPAYEAFFYGKTTQERIIIEFDEKPADLAHACLIGFNDSMEATKSIQDVLLESGYTNDEIPELFSTYELDKVHYLPCAHLPQVPQRMVLILAALRSSRPALVLKDPFMPFSGRWREHFAKILYQNALERNRVIVCTNLSFVPQSWSQSNLMQYLDVGQAAEEARARYHWEQERKERELQLEKQKKADEAPVAEASVKEGITTDKTALQGDSSSIVPEPLQFLYREVQDRIFTPLKEISDFFRSYGALVVVGSMAFLIATMGVVMAPNLSVYRERMKALSTDISFTTVWNAMTAPIPEPNQNPISEIQESSEAPDSDTPIEQAHETLALLAPEFDELLPTVIETKEEAFNRVLIEYTLNHYRFDELSCGETPLQSSLLSIETQR